MLQRRARCRTKLQRTVKWYEKAANQGNAAAQYNLGYCYVHGQGVKQDNEEAMKWFKSAAEQGQAEAQNLIGYCYFFEEYYIEAVNWFKKAANQGNTLALGNLGICYYEGKGVTRNHDEAFRYLYKSASSENTSHDVMMYLSKCYRFGYGTQKNEKQAEYWLKKAAENNNYDAMRLIQTRK